MAFSTGTGVLTFIDLAIRIFLQNAGLLPESYEKLASDFKFALYVSHIDRESSCCLELCEKIQMYCIEHGFDNFQLYVRLSQEHGKKLGMPYWTKDWIKQ